MKCVINALLSCFYVRNHNLKCTKHVYEPTKYVVTMCIGVEMTKFHNCYGVSRAPLSLGFLGFPARSE